MNAAGCHSVKTCREQRRALLPCFCSLYSCQDQPRPELSLRNQTDLTPQNETEFML